MMGKTKEPPLNKDESKTTGKRVAEVDNPEKISHDTSADLNEDETAAVSYTHLRAHET